MNQTHSRTPCQQAQWASRLLADRGCYGVVTMMSQELGVARQTLYRWKAKGQAALEAAFTPGLREADRSCALERAILTRLLEGHASYRGIQRCLLILLGEEVSLGTIATIVQTAGQRAQQWLTSQMPTTGRALALDELYGSQRGAGYLTVVDAGSGAVWASTSPVAVDGESWTLLLWQLEEQGLRWHTLVSDGGKAIQEVVGTVAAEQNHQRDVWHVLHLCQQVQGRLDRQVAHLQGQTSTVARQAARVGAGKPPRGRHPQSDVAAHAGQMAQAQYAAESLRYLSAELRQLLGVVVLAPVAQQDILSSQMRQGDLEALLGLLDELSQQASTSMQPELAKLLTHLQAALPSLVRFAAGLDTPQEQACHHLGASAVHLLGWAWQRHSLLGPSSAQLLASLPPDWQPIAQPMLQAWDEAVRASSAVKNWHSILRPHLAVHRTLSTGLLALLAVWHNHRIAERCLHQGQSPMPRSGMADAPGDWIVALGYPPEGAAATPAPEIDQQPEVLAA